ncbi:hypothetical protein BBA71_08765 [Acetobacter pasteurianus]|nr:hypothetical protein BBA71_08765 [Acetobacter pasteurianus]
MLFIHAAGTKGMTVHGLRSTFRDWAGETKVCSREAAYFQSDLLDFRQDKAGDWLVKVRALR